MFDLILPSAFSVIPRHLQSLSSSPELPSTPSPAPAGSPQTSSSGSYWPPPASSTPPPPSAEPERMVNSENDGPPWQYGLIAIFVLRGANNYWEKWRRPDERRKIVGVWRWCFCEMIRIVVDSTNAQHSVLHRNGVRTLTCKDPCISWTLCCSSDRSKFRRTLLLLMVLCRVWWFLSTTDTQRLQLCCWFNNSWHK